MDESVKLPTWLPTSVNALQTFLKSHPDAEQQMHSIFDKYPEKIDAANVTALLADLGGYLGKEITDLVIEVIQANQQDRLQEFSKVIPDDPMNFLRKIISLYGPKFADTFQDVKQSSAKAFETFLKSHPNAEDHVREILDKRLSKIDANSWTDVFASLDNYMGTQSTNILFDIAQTDQAKRLEEASQSLSPEGIDFLRKIISLYGSELASAFVISNQLPNNWKLFYRDVYYDYVNKRSHIRVRIAKYNGEEPFIEGNADSILELTIFMIQTLLFLPVPDLIGQPMSDGFIQEANKLINFLQPPETIADSQLDSKAAE